MSLNIRRVVTGHDGAGRAKVTIDEICRNVGSGRAGQQSCVVWTTDTSPATNEGSADNGQCEVVSTSPGGTVFRIVRYEPGVAPRLHRTSSIDYAVVLAGEIDMELDGETVRLRAGDVLVQRGTLHNWVNRGAVACIIAFVLIDAKPVAIDGTSLAAVG